MASPGIGVVTRIFAQGARPGLAVLRVFDRDVLGPEADDTLDQLVGVPDPQFLQLVDLVEFVLDPVRQRAVTEPHLLRRDSVLVLGVKAGAIDGILGPHIRLGAGGGGRDIRDRIGVRFDRERPYLALGNRPAGGADFIDPPIIGGSEIELSGLIGGVALPNTAHTVIDVLEVLAQVDDMPVAGRHFLGRCPPQRYVAGHIDVPSGRDRLGRRPRRKGPLHDLGNLFIRQRHVVDAHIVEQTLEGPAAGRTFSNAQRIGG